MGIPAKVLGARDVRRLLSHVRRQRHATRNAVLILLSVKAGLRAAEMAGLDWTMVLKPDGKMAPLITVSCSIAKNGAGRRIPINPGLARALTQLWKQKGRPQNGPVIRSERGAHMTPGAVVNWFQKLYAELGLQGCSSHSGRRTFITRSARLLPKIGGSLRDIQILAGHASLTTTQGYIDGDSDAQRRLIRLL